MHAQPHLHQHAHRNANRHGHPHRLAHAQPHADAQLEPGSYTAFVRGKNNTQGIALVEVFHAGP